MSSRAAFRAVPACAGSGPPARRRPRPSARGQSQPGGTGEGRFHGGWVRSWAILRERR
jgi:hypothetical protein